MISINTLTNDQFAALPLVVEGESKEVRYAGYGEVIIRLKPTVYSFTHNRAGIVEGSDTVRLQAIQALLPVLHRAGITHTYREVNDRWIRSQLVLQPIITDEPLPFRPTDLTAAALAALPRANPVEVVAKAIHSGTPKHRYYRFGDYPLRDGCRGIQPEAKYPEPVVRFDWRNPMYDTSRKRLADEVLPEAMADWFIDVTQARQTALRAFTTLQKHLQKRGLELWDICFFIAEDGRTMFGEVSPDCLRVRAADGSALDKDVWRSGGSSDQVLQKWQLFADLLKDN